MKLYRLIHEDNTEIDNQIWDFDDESETQKVFLLQDELYEELEFANDECDGNLPFYYKLVEIDTNTGIAKIDTPYLKYQMDLTKEEKIELKNKKFYFCEKWY